MFKVVVGHSDAIEAADALNEIMKQLAPQCGGASPSVCLLFASAHCPIEGVLKGINDAFPGIELVGCTSDSELSSIHGFMESSISAAFFLSDTIEIRAGVAKNLSRLGLSEIAGAVEAAKSRITGGLGVSLCLAFPESIKVNASNVLNALNEALGGSVPVAGGAAADVVENAGAYSLRQLYNGEVLEDAVPFLLFSGPVEFSFGVASGWKTFGKEMVVTSSDGGEVKLLDGQPAADIYAYHVGGQKRVFTMEYGMFPLAILDKASGEFIMRSSISLNEQTGSMHFMGEVPQGSTVKIANALHDWVAQGAAESVEKALGAYTGNPAAAFLFSCAGRRFCLGMRTREEFANVITIIGGNIPVCGFYSFGEISPLMSGKPAVLHNCTFVTLLLGEKPV